MTLYVVDVSKYQVERSNPLNLATALAAGFGGVNIALDRGRAEDVLPTWALGYATAARALGMEVSTYRWLDNRLSGAASARRAYDRMVALGGPDGMAHAVDCEDNATEAVVRDYVTVMTSLLGRPIALYTGDWWWMAPGRKWSMAEAAPYLWAAPNVGYPGAYPGDDSPMWTAGYAGWPVLTAMQYAVKPLAGTGDCSLTAVRDMAAWRALTGRTSVSGYTDWVNAGKPVSGVARPVARLGARLKSYGYTVYYIGNDEHMKHNPPEDHTPFAATGWPITSPRWWIFALDIMPPPAGSSLPSLQQLGARMLADAKAGHPGMRWLKYMNWEPEKNNGGACYQERFMPTYERRTSGDRGHIHGSARSDCKDSTLSDDYDPVALIRNPPRAEEKEADMQPVLIRIEGDSMVRLVTMGIGHIPVTDETDLKRWQQFMKDNNMNTTVWPWPAAMLPQCGPDLTAVAVLEVTPEVATVIAQQIVAAGSNDLSDADLDTIAKLVVTGAKKAAREGTGIQA